MSAQVDVRDYRFWFVRLVDHAGTAGGWLPSRGNRGSAHGKALSGALALALVPYLLSLALVAPFGYAWLYLRTPAFYIGLVGIAWVLFAAVRSVEILADALSDLMDVAVDKRNFFRYVDARMANAARSRANIGFLIPFFAGAAIIVVDTLRRWRHSGPPRADHQFHAFMVDWHAPGASLPIGLSLGVYAFPVALTIGSSVILLCRNLAFAWGLQRHAYIPFPGRVRLSIRPLITAYAWASGTWLAGIALFVLFFFKHWSGLNMLGIALGAGLGILTFVAPYYTFRKILDRSHEEMGAHLARSVGPVRSSTRLSPSTAAEFATVNAVITADPPPVLTRRGVIAYGVGLVVTLGTIFAKDVLQEELSFLAKTPSSPSTPAAQAKTSSARR